MNKTANLLKHSLKKKRKITLSFIVTFLITGMVSFATDEEIDKNLSINNEVVGEMTLDNGDYHWKNDETLKGQVNVGSSLASEDYHIYINNSGNIINTISSIKDRSLNLGNGISASAYFNDAEAHAAEINKIQNSGLILGRVEANADLNIDDRNDFINLGNGIGASSYSTSKAKTATIQELENSGSIRGEVLIEDIDKKLISSGNGIGISSFASSSSIDVEASSININTLKNIGEISGKVNSIHSVPEGFSNVGNGIGISSYAYESENFHQASSGNIKIETIINTGKISSNIGKIVDIKLGNNIGNGIGIGTFSRGGTDKPKITEIKKIENNGIIISEIESPDNNFLEESSNIGNGIGISSFADEGNSKGVILGSFENNGVISSFLPLAQIANNSKDKDTPIINVSNGIGISLYGENTNSISIGDIQNNGNISGEINSLVSSILDKVAGNNFGNGIGIWATGKQNENIKVNSIINNGIVKGNIKEIKTDENIFKKPENIGNGIGIGSTNGEVIVKELTNNGTIIGKEHGIYVKGDKGEVETYNNYGVIVGKTPVDIGSSTNNNHGLEIKIDDSGKIVSINNTQKENLATINNTQYKVINGEVKENDTIAITTDKLGENNSNLILNGANLTLDVTEKVSLKDSIINSYKTAIKINDNSTFNGENVIINGGGIDGDTAVIIGDTGENNLVLSGNSIINGSIDLGEGTDTLTFGQNAISKNTQDSNINIFDTISNVEDINVNQNVTLFETSKISNGENITVSENGKLIVRLGSEEDETGIKEHGLYDSGTQVSTNGNGEISFVLNGHGDGTIISLGDNKDVNGKNTSFDEEAIINTSSALHSLVEKDGHLEVKAIGVLKDYEKYPQLNKIHQSIVTSRQDGNFTNVTEEKYGDYLSYLTDIYSATPYSYSSELSRKSANMFASIVTSKDLNPDVNKWSISGGYTHLNGGIENNFYGRGYYISDLGAKNTDVDTTINGMSVQGEYGYNSNTTLGIIFGGNKTESEINDSSKVEGDNFYLGVFGKKYIGNLKLTLGAGYQYGDYETNRTAIGYNGITETRNFDETYSDNTFNIYTQAKYSNKLSNGLYLEPYFGLNYTYINQDSVDENGELGLEIDSKDISYTTFNFGVDFRKDIVTTNLKHSLVAGVFYNRLLDGYKEEYLNGRFHLGSDFDMLVANRNKHEVGTQIKYQVETKNNILFDINGSYIFERSSYSNTIENKNKGEWILGIGLGYKF